jgi:hypothetical protein
MDEVIFMISARLKLKLTDLGAVGKPRLLRSASVAELRADEERLGFRLPPLLQQIYCTIGNGGFGPGYGLIGMSSGPPDDTGKTAPEIYRDLRSGDPDDASWSWPADLLPICHWGCAIYSCIDCSDQDFRMRIFDPNVHRASASWLDAFFDEASSFQTWITAWAEGVDLWNIAYGKHGRVTRVLAERKRSQ